MENCGGRVIVDTLAWRGSITDVIQNHQHIVIIKIQLTFSGCDYYLQIFFSNILSYYLHVRQTFPTTLPFGTPETWNMFKEEKVSPVDQKTLSFKEKAQLIYIMNFPFMTSKFLNKLYFLKVKTTNPLPADNK